MAAGGGSVQLVVTVDPAFRTRRGDPDSAVLTSPDDSTCAACTPPPVTTTIVSPALHLTKSVDKTTATPGATLTYTLGYSNTGTGAASSVVNV